MKLSKVILENKTVVENIELALTANDVEHF